MARTPSHVSVALLVSLLQLLCAAADASGAIVLRAQSLGVKDVTLAATCEEKHTLSADQDTVVTLRGPKKLWLVPNASTWECSKGCPGCFFVESSTSATGALSVRLGLEKQSTTTEGDEGLPDDVGEGSGDEDGDDDDGDEGSDEDTDPVKQQLSEGVAASAGEFHGHATGDSSAVGPRLKWVRWANGTQDARLVITGRLPGRGGGGLRLRAQYYCRYVCIRRFIYRCIYRWGYRVCRRIYRVRCFRRCFW